MFSSEGDALIPGAARTNKPNQAKPFNKQNPKFPTVPQITKTFAEIRRNRVTEKHPHLAR
jgi:hypothetical protein